VANDQNLGFLDLGVDAKEGANGEGTSLSGTILTLGNEVEVSALVVLGNEGNGDGLDVGRLQKAQLFRDTLLQVRLNREVILVVPRSLLVDEGT